MAIKMSLVVIGYEMMRELPRTLLSLSPRIQRGIAAEDYEVVVVDNGSLIAVDPTALDLGGLIVRTVSVPRAAKRVSPCGAINLGLAEARGPLVGVLIDGARMASPGLLSSALGASQAYPDWLIVTLAFHLGPKVQMESVAEGYNQLVEDDLLERVRWEEDGYRLFDISVFAASSKKGWIAPIKESNALFLTADQWRMLGGYDENFRLPGGGYANLDVLCRAIEFVDGKVITLRGEGTFHQVHGGIATNSLVSRTAEFAAEYERIRKKRFRVSSYSIRLFGDAEPRGDSKIRIQ